MCCLKHEQDSKERSGGNGAEAHSTTQLLTTLVLLLMGGKKKNESHPHFISNLYYFKGLFRYCLLLKIENTVEK